MATFDLILTWTGKPNYKNFSLITVYAFLCGAYNSPTVLFILKLSYSQPHYRRFFQHSNTLDDT